MSSESTELSLSKLVDLAIGTPESGSVDFSSLHTLLHIIVRKLGAQTSLVELSADQQRQLDSQIRTLDQDPGLRVSIQQRDGQELFQVHESYEEVGRDEQEEVEVEEEKSPSTATKIETPVSSIRLSSDENLNLVQKIEQLEERTSILPSNEELQRYLSSRESLKPDEPVDFITLATRVDVIEISLGKLMSTIEDVMFEFARLEKLVLPYLDGGDITVLKTQVHNINHLLAENYPGFRSRQSSERTSALRRLTIEQLPTDFYKRDVPSINVITRSEYRQSHRYSMKYGGGSPRASQELEWEREIEGIKSVLNGLIGLLPLAEPSESALVVSESDLQCEESVEKLPKANFHQKAADAIINLRSVQKEIDEIFQEKEERLAFVEKVVDKLKELQNWQKSALEELQAAFVEIREGFENFKENSEKSSMEFRDDLDARMKAVSDDVTYLKNDTVKRIIQLEFDVGDRVDFELFKTRVPMDTFEISIEKLNEDLQRYKEKLDQYGAGVTDKQAELLKDVRTKVDRTEFATLQRNMTNRFGLFQLRLNKLIKIQESIDAAGTKLKLAGKLKCISCDHEATMNVLQDIIPKNKIPQRSQPLVVDGGWEFQHRVCGGPHTLLSQKKRTKAFDPKSGEARRLVGQINKQVLDFGLNAVPPEDPTYKIHQ